MRDLLGERPAEAISQPPLTAPARLLSRVQIDREKAEKGSELER